MNFIRYKSIRIMMVITSALLLSFCTTKKQNVVNLSLTISPFLSEIRKYAISDEIYIQINSNAKYLQCKIPNSEYFDCVTYDSKWNLSNIPSGLRHGEFIVRASNDKNNWTYSSLILDSFENTQILACDISVPKNNYNLSNIVNYIDDNKTTCLDDGVIFEDNVNDLKQILEMNSANLLARVGTVAKIDINFNYLGLEIHGNNFIISGLLFESSNSNPHTIVLLGDDSNVNSYSSSILYNNSFKVNSTNQNSAINVITSRNQNADISYNNVEIGIGTNSIGIILSSAGNNQVATNNIIYGTSRGTVGILSESHTSTITNNKITLIANSGGGLRTGIKINNTSANLNYNQLYVDGNEGNGIIINGGNAVLSGNTIVTSGNSGNGIYATDNASNFTLNANIIKRSSTGVNDDGFAVFISGTNGGFCASAINNIICKIGEPEWSSSQSYGLRDDDPQLRLSNLWNLTNQTQIGGYCH